MLQNTQNTKTKQQPNTVSERLTLNKPAFRKFILPSRPLHSDPSRDQKKPIFKK